jgi:hypothetical protein
VASQEGLSSMELVGEDGTILLLIYEIERHEVTACKIEIPEY